MQTESDTDVKVEKKHENKRKKVATRLRDAIDQWVILQLLAVFTLSFAIGILFMHGTILWHQYKHGYGYFSSSPLPFETVLPGFTLDQFPNIKNDIYEWSHGRLRVNTSLYVR